MNKLLQTTLVSAIMATSGFATTIEGSATYRNGWDITGSDAASIASDAMITMQGESNAASDISISGTASLTNNGTIIMHDVSAIISKSTADPAFINAKTLDLSNTTDFSRFDVTVSNSDKSKVVIPAPNYEGNTATKLTFNSPAGENDTYSLEYEGSGQTLGVENTKLVIQEDGGAGIYDDTTEVTSKTGIQFDDATKVKLVNTGNGLDLSTMNAVIAHAENKEENQDKTFDLGQEKLNSRDIELSNDTTIHFGLVGTADENMNVTGDYKLSLNGDSSGMLGKISAEGSVEFADKASNGDMDIEKTLILSYTTGSQTLAGIINANAIIIPSGANIILSNKLTTGWQKVLELLFDSSVMTSSNKIGALTYTIYNDKVYSSNGEDGSVMTLIEGAALPEFPQTTAIHGDALKFTPRPGEVEFQLWRSSDDKTVSMISYNISNFCGLEQYYFNESEPYIEWSSSSQNMNSMDTNYINISDMQSKYMVMDGIKFYTPLTRYDLFLTNTSIVGSCYYLKGSTYYILDQDTIAWYKQGESEPSTNRTDWNLTNEAYNAAIDDLGLVLQLKK